MWKHNHWHTEAPLSHCCYLYYLLQALEEEAVPWQWTFEFKPRNPTALCICVLCELESLSNHEEQLSCPASWCAHCSAVVSGLLWHQMAVSILTRAAISFFRPFTIFTLPYTQTMSNPMMSWRYTILCGSFLHVVVFYGVEGPWQFWNGPQHSSCCMFCTCASHERDNTLVGCSSGYEAKPLCFIDFR